MGRDLSALSLACLNRSASSASHSLSTSGILIATSGRNVPSANVLSVFKSMSSSVTRVLKIAHASDASWWAFSWCPYIRVSFSLISACRSAGSSFKLTIMRFTGILFRSSLVIWTSMTFSVCSCISLAAPVFFPSILFLNATHEMSGIDLYTASRSASLMNLYIRKFEATDHMDLITRL